MSALQRWLRLALRMQRWEVIAVVTGTAALLGASLFVTQQLRDLAAAYPRCLDPTTVTAGCDAYHRAVGRLDMPASLLLQVSWAAPFGTGLVLGVPLVAREIEHRTASLAWTLSRSRVRWLVGRAAFVVLVTVALLAAVAITSELLAAAYAPARHLDSDFTWYGRRGVLLVVRGLVVLGLGISIGAVVGRALPALLVAVFGTVLLFTGISLAMDRWNAAEATARPYGQGESDALALGARIELTDGEVVGDAYLASLENIVIDADGSVYSRFDPDSGLPDRSSLVGRYRELMLPGERYPQVVARESAVGIGAAVLLLLAAGAIVRHRRPGA
ncbi:MAG TPA: hypothetical protein VFL75_02785 [Candidatus Limnocylindria bacterium]|jgi:hypothetical protein|nr:hypothetical protein [Candidatus Limnocylindria bacterium]